LATASAIHSSLVEKTDATPRYGICHMSGHPGRFRPRLRFGAWLVEGMSIYANVPLKAFQTSRLTDIAHLLDGNTKLFGGRKLAQQPEEVPSHCDLMRNVNPSLNPVCPA